LEKYCANIMRVVEYIRACLKSRFRSESAEFGLWRSEERRTHSEEGVWKPNAAKPQGKGGACSRNGDFKQALRSVCGSPIERACAAATLSCCPRAVRGARASRGQTTVEYLLASVALVIVFAMMYKFFNWYLNGQFRSGAGLILRMYKQDPW